MLNLLLSLVMIYLITSLWESVLHWKILHASRRARLQWKRIGGVFNLLRKAYFSHTMIHHRKTYSTSYYTQFDSTEEKRRLDSKLLDHPHLRIIENRYGLTISGFWQNTVFLAIPISAALLVFVYLAPYFIWLGILVATVPMLLSKYVHPLLHEPEAVLEDLSIVLRRFVKTRYFRFIRLYHYIHHRYPACNFNLMIGGDYLLGVARSLFPKPDGTPGPLHLTGYRVIKPFFRITKEQP